MWTEQMLVLEKHLKARGFYCYREHFRWGFTPAFRNDAGEYLFLDKGVIRTPGEMLAHLVEDWQPASWDDRVYFSYQMASDFRTMERVAS